MTRKQRRTTGEQIDIEGIEPPPPVPEGVPEAMLEAMLKHPQKTPASMLRGVRLGIWWVMADGAWRTARTVARLTHNDLCTTTARIRDLRKPAYGAYTVNCRRNTRGAYEYQLVTE